MNNESPPSPVPRVIGCHCPSETTSIVHSRTPEAWTVWRSGDAKSAVAVLETAIARAGRDDWQNRMGARSLLAELYAQEGRVDEAAVQHRIVLQNSYRTELLDKARAYLQPYN